MEPRPSSNAPTPREPGAPGLVIDGVHSAEVNLATEAATVSFDPQSAGLSELTAAVAAVAAAGYTATPRHAAGAQPVPRDGQDAAATAEVAQDAQLRDPKRIWPAIPPRE